MTDDDLVRQLQERAARGLPAEHVERLGGWWLRYAPSCAWWVNSVLPHGPGSVDAAEAFYRSRGLAPRFQVTPGACTPGLDVVLAARGYRTVGSLSLQVAPRAVVTSRSVRFDMRYDAQPTCSWFDAWHGVSGHDTSPVAERALLARIDGPAVYASALSDGVVVAVGRAVADTGWAGVFGMATLPAARGRGAGRAVLAALADWARSVGARSMYLQVERDNPAALRLYERAGFREVRAYHYRVAEERLSGRVGQGRSA